MEGEQTRAGRPCHLGEIWGFESAESPPHNPPHWMQELVQQLIIGLSLGASYALIALGYTMVYGVLRLINFAHGEVYMVGGVAAYDLARIMARADHPAGLRSGGVVLGA